MALSIYQAFYRMNKQLYKYEGLVKTSLLCAIENASSLCKPLLANIHKILCTELSTSEQPFVIEHNLTSGSDCASNGDWEAVKQKCSMGMCCICAPWMLRVKIRCNNQYLPHLVICLWLYLSLLLSLTHNRSWHCSGLLLPTPYHKINLFCSN